MLKVEKKRRIKAMRIFLLTFFLITTPLFSNLWAAKRLPDHVPIKVRLTWTGGVTGGSAEFRWKDDKYGERFPMLVNASIYKADYTLSAPNTPGVNNQLWISEIKGSAKIELIFDYIDYVFFRADCQGEGKNIPFTKACTNLYYGNEPLPIKVFVQEGRRGVYVCFREDGCPSF